MKFLYVLAIICISSLATACTLAERLEVQVFGDQSIPLEGVQVTVTYQKNTNLTNDGYITGLTDSNGIFTADLCDEVDKSIASPYYNIEVQASTQSQSRKTSYGENTYIVSGVHYEPFELSTTFQHAIVVVEDLSNNTYPYVEVDMTSPHSIARTTDKNGQAIFPVEAFTQFSLTSSVNGVSASDTFSMENTSKTVFLILPIFNALVTINVLDEQNKPIANALVTITDGASRSGTTDSNGVVNFYNVNGSKINVSVEHEDISFQKSFDLSQSKTITIPFTTNSIQILSYNADVNSTNKSCIITFYANISDIRKTPTVFESYVNYSFDNTSWSVQKMSNTTGSTKDVLFQFTTHCPVNSSFNAQYILSASDNYSSKETGISSVSVKLPVEPASGNTLANTSSNSTNTSQSQEKPQSTIDWLISIFSLLIVAFGAISIVFITLRIFKKQK